MRVKPESAPIVAERVASRLASEIKNLDVAGALSILRSVDAEHGKTIRLIDAYLELRPDALSAGVSDCPAGLVRVLRALHTAGHAVALPCCAGCGRNAGFLRNAPGGRLCYMCAARANHRTCDRCGKQGRVAAKREEGVICYGCYEKDPEIRTECATCGQLRRAAQRMPDGTRICENCYRRPSEVCVGCGQLRPVKARQPRGSVCDSCYCAPARRCGQCGRVRPVARRGDGELPDLCDGCYQGAEPCLPGMWTCPALRWSSDWPANLQELPAAPTSQVLPLQSCETSQCRLAIGPVCTACYEHIRNNPAPCARCAVPQPLIAITADGDPICGPCAGVVVNYFCRTCGDGGRQYADGECVRCVLAHRLDDLLADDHCIIPEQLRPVRVALGEVEHPISIIGWLRKSESARLLARLARMREPITHELLDSLPPSRNLYYVRDVLVHTSVLEPWNEYLERLGPWLDEVLAEQPAHIGRTIRPFMHWYILRRARRRAKARPFTTASGANARGHVRVAIALLAWLGEQGAALSEITQAHVDTWLESGSTDRYDIRYFRRSRRIGRTP